MSETDDSAHAEDLSEFLEEVREFIRDNLTDDLRREAKRCAGIYADRPVAQKWLSILNDRGWAVPHWPVEHGGANWSLRKQHALQRELALAGAPFVSPNSTHMVGPVIIALGTEEQKKAYLPKIRSGEDWWAQGYSEPGSGSDLASLKCRAQRDGDEYVINGSKIWTTHAHWSNKMFCLVRTDSSGKPQQGISFLLFDLDLPGVTISPIISISGDHELNQVFFDDVRVPASGLVGAENDGWTVAKFLLQHERSASMFPVIWVELQRIKQIARELRGADGAPLMDDPVLSRDIAETEIRLRTMEALELKSVEGDGRGPQAAILPSILKVRYTELRQEVSALGMRVAGPDGLIHQPDARCVGAEIPVIGPESILPLTAQYLNHRAASIYAGSNEIQRNLIAKAVLAGAA